MNNTIIAQTTKPGNFKRSEWGRHVDKDMEVKANLDWADETLDRYPDLDSEMDSHQERAYGLLRQTDRKLQMVQARTSEGYTFQGIKDALETLRSASGQFHAAEKVESRMEATVDKGHNHVKDGRVASREACGHSDEQARLNRGMVAVRSDRRER